jgi:hypothetical protein
MATLSIISPFCILNLFLISGAIPPIYEIKAKENFSLHFAGESLENSRQVSNVEGGLKFADEFLCAQKN